MAVDVAVIGIEYRTDGLEKGTRALKDNERQANKTADANDGLSKALSGAEKSGRALGLTLAGGVTGAIAAVASINKLIEGVAKYQDIAEKTGGSAAGFASIRTAADVAGTSVESAAHSANRLSVNLSKVDDEGKGAGKALAAIGLDLEKFRKLSPDVQLREVGKALNSYTDGASKAAVANALFGRGGAEMLPFLKELGNETNRLTLLTDAQIAAADDYADANARTLSEIRQLAEATAMLALPAMTAFSGAVRDTIEDLLGLSNGVDSLSGNTGIQDFAIGAARAIAFVVDQVDLLIRLLQTAGKGLGGLLAAEVAFTSGEFKRAGRIIQEMNKDISGVWSRSTLGANLEKRIAEMNNGEKKITDDQNKQLQQRELNYNAVTKRMGRVKDPDSDFKTYLSNLEKQIQKTYELSTVEKLLDDIRRKSLTVTPAQQERLMLLAKEVDITKEAIRVSDERAAQRKKDYEDSASGIREIEAADRARLKALTDSGPAAQLEKQRKEMLFLAEAYEKGRLGVVGSTEAMDAFNDAATGFLNLGKAIQEADSFAKKFAENVQDSLGDGLFDIMQGNFKNIGDSFKRMLDRMVAEAIAADISRKLFGSMVQGGTGGGMLGSMVSAGMSLFSGMSLGNVMGTMSANAAGTGLDGLISSTGGWGTVPSAKGNVFNSPGLSAYSGQIVSNPTLFPFAKGAGLMGEAGPEAIMPLKRGADGKLGVSGGGQSVTVTNHFVLQSPADQRTQAQIAAKAGASVQRAMARNT